MGSTWKQRQSFITIHDLSDIAISATSTVLPCLAMLHRVYEE